MPIYTLSRRPEEIPDLIHWFDANDISTINTGSSDGSLPLVYTLKDKVSSMVLSQNGYPPKISSLIINGHIRTLIFFHGSSSGKQSLSGFLPDSSFNTTKTIFFVCLPEGSLYNGYQFSILQSHNPLVTTGHFGVLPDISLREEGRGLIYLETDMYHQLIYINFNGSNAVNIISVSIDETSKGIFTNNIWSHSIYSSNNVTPFQVGSKLIIGDVTDVPYTPDSSIPPYASPPKTLFGEMLIYNRSLTDEEVIKVNQYLKTKWIG
jgi:hypothetical protein